MSSCAPNGTAVSKLGPAARKFVITATGPFAETGVTGVSVPNSDA
jgi:hypothetical protein